MNRIGQLVVTPSPDVSRWESYDESDGLLGNICSPSTSDSIAVVIATTEHVERRSVLNNGYPNVVVCYSRYVYVMHSDGCFWICVSE